MSARHSKPPVDPGVFDRQFEWSRIAGSTRAAEPLNDRIAAYVEARRKDKGMEDSEIREACLTFEQTGEVITDETAVAIAERWPGLRGIGTVKEGAFPSLELYGSVKTEQGKRQGDFVEDINELRELNALAAWAVAKGVQS